MWHYLSRSARTAHPPAAASAAGSFALSPSLAASSVSFIAPPIIAASAAAAVPSLAHSTGLIASDGRRGLRYPGGEWVSHRARPVPRQHHFDPLEPAMFTHHPPKPLDKPHGLHRKVSPRLAPPEATHTNARMPTNFKQQFQLEPATRTRIQYQGVNTKILDYRRSEVFTRAPWPCFREIMLNCPSTLQALSPGLMLQLQNMITGVEFNKDITAVTLQPQHGGADRPLRGRSNHVLEVMLRQAGVVDRDRPPTTYEKTFCGGMCMDTITDAVEKSLKGKERHAARLVEKGVSASQASVSVRNRWSPRSVEEVRDALQGSPHAAKYFRSVYSLCWKMSMVRLPMVSILDGLVLGAGAGVFTQQRYRVATENTRFAFPQVAQGWFPDAGASYTLSHLDGSMGMFLGLTGWHVRGFDAVRLGLATHYCESDEVFRFGKRMGDSSLHYQFAEDTIEQAFGLFNEGTSHFPLPFHQMHAVVGDIFGVDKLDRVYARLGRYFEARGDVDGVAQAQRALIKLQGNNNEGNNAGASGSNGSSTSLQQEQQQLNQMKQLFTSEPAIPPFIRHTPALTAFAHSILHRLSTASPTSLKLTFRLLQLAQWLPLERCIQLEYRLAQRLLCRLPDPRDSELFRTINANKHSNGNHSSSSNVVWNPSPSDARVEELLAEDWDVDQELLLEFPKRKEPRWYI